MTAKIKMTRKPAPGATTPADEARIASNIDQARAQRLALHGMVNAELAKSGLRMPS